MTVRSLNQKFQLKNGNYDIFYVEQKLNHSEYYFTEFFRITKVEVKVTHGRFQVTSKCLLYKIMMEGGNLICFCGSTFEQSVINRPISLVAYSRFSFIRLNHSTIHESIGQCLFLDEGLFPMRRVPVRRRQRTRRPIDLRRSFPSAIQGPST